MWGLNEKYGTGAGFISDLLTLVFPILNRCAVLL
jgi:hypothetical protein